MGKVISEKKRKPVYYWDACIFIALLGKEQRKAGEMQGVRSIANANIRKENIIATSAITRTEIFRNNEVNERFKETLRRSTIIEISADPKISEKASVIRRKINELYKDEKKQISTPDSIHLATAIIYGVDAFHTFDEKNSESGKKNIKWLGLLPLSGKKEIDGLRIEKPPVKQYILDLQERKP